ncbi:hypothetical protein ACLK1Y_23240 [Escherichia coli]
MLGVTPLTAIASFAVVSALFVLPTYPTLLAAVEWMTPADPYRQIRV